MKKGRPGVSPSRQQSGSSGGPVAADPALSTLCGCLAPTGRSPVLGDSGSNPQPTTAVTSLPRAPCGSAGPPPIPAALEGLSRAEREVAWEITAEGGALMAECDLQTLGSLLS